MFTNDELKKVNDKLEEIEKKTEGRIENIEEFDRNISKEIRNLLENEEIISFLEKNVVFLTEDKKGLDKKNGRKKEIISFLEKNVIFLAKDKKEAAENIDKKIFLLISMMLRKTPSEIMMAMQMKEFSRMPVLDRILKFKIDFLSDTIYDDLGIKNIKIEGENLHIQIKKDATPEQVERIMELNKQLREEMAKAKIKVEEAEVID